jgi:hypothetical protein
MKEMWGNKNIIYLITKPCKEALFIFLLLIVIVISPSSLKAQRSGGGEIGAFVGASYYMGDINLARHMYSPNLNLGGFYKHHLNSRYSIRIGAIFSSLNASDFDFSKSEFQQLRAREFSTSIIEGSLQVEFNFLSYVIGETRKRNYTPYIQTGLCYYYASDSDDPMSFAIPFGIGFKVNLNRRLVFATEWVMRRSFSDLIDNLSSEDLFNYNNVTTTPMSEAPQIRQYGFRMNKDWYFYAGVSLSYSFSWGGFPCPAYDVY